MLSVHPSVHQSIRPSWNTPPPQQMIFLISSEHWYLQAHCVRTHIRCCAGWYPSTCTCTCIYWTAYATLWLAKSLKQFIVGDKHVKESSQWWMGTQMCVLQGGGGELAFFSLQTTEYTPNTDVNTWNKSWQTTRWTEELQLQLQLLSST